MGFSTLKPVMHVPLGAIFILLKDIGVGGPENGNFPLLYVVKMSLHRWIATDINSIDR